MKTYREAKRKNRLIFFAPIIIIAVIIGVFFVVKHNAGKEGVSDETGSAEEERVDSSSGKDTEPELSPEELYEIELSKRVEEALSGMSLEEKLCQMFIVTPEMLTGVDTATSAGEATKAAYNTYPVGGVIYFKKNLLHNTSL